MKIIKINEDEKKKIIRINDPIKKFSEENIIQKKIKYGENLEIQKESLKNINENENKKENLISLLKPGKINENPKNEFIGNKNFLKNIVEDQEKKNFENLFEKNEKKSKIISINRQEKEEKRNIKEIIQLEKKFEEKNELRKINEVENKKLEV